MGNLVGMESSPISTADLIQQMTSLVWALNGNAEPFISVTSARVGSEVYQRISDSRMIDVYQAQCILAITKYIEEHPSATDSEMAVVLKVEIEQFRRNVDAL